MHFELNEQQKNNLMVFLNRVPIQGLEEISVINEILVSLSSPINKNTDVDTKEKVNAVNEIVALSIEAVNSVNENAV